MLLNYWKPSRYVNLFVCHWLCQCLALKGLGRTHHKKDTGRASGTPNQDRNPSVPPRRPKAIPSLSVQVGAEVAVEAVVVPDSWMVVSNRLVHVLGQ